MASMNHFFREVSLRYYKINTWLDSIDLCCKCSEYLKLSPSRFYKRDQEDYLRQTHALMYRVHRVHSQVPTHHFWKCKVYFHRLPDYKSIEF
jgi:hypothetical protein